MATPPTPAFAVIVAVAVTDIEFCGTRFRNAPALPERDPLSLANGGRY
jgi:hypothetical protein